MRVYIIIWKDNYLERSRVMWPCLLSCKVKIYDSVDKEGWKVFYVFVLIHIFSPQHLLFCPSFYSMII